MRQWGPAYDSFHAASADLMARYRDRRATGGTDAARGVLQRESSVFIGQMIAGWNWAHER